MMRKLLAPVRALAIVIGTPFVGLVLYFYAFMAAIFGGLFVVVAVLPFVWEYVRKQRADAG